MPKLNIPYGIKIPATLCVLRSERGLLLLQRIKAPHIGKFCPLGGKIDPNETPHDAAVREIYEEAGQKLDTLTLAGILTETGPTDYNWIDYVYTSTVPGFDPPPCNEGVLRWVHFDDLASVPTPETDWHIYDHLVRGQFFAFDAIFDEQTELVSLRDEITGNVLFRRE